MAMKKDDDKSKRTLSGKKPATFGGANSKLIKPKPTALTSSGPRAEPPRPMGKDATGERNWDKSSKPRATVSVGPATLSMGGKTSKSKGGMNMTGGKVMPKKSSPMAKMSGSPSSASSSAIQAQLDAIKKEDNKWNKSNTAAASIVGGFGVGAALSSKKVRQALAKPFKYIADTKNRRARNKAQKAENDAMIVERKAKTEAKNPSTPVAKVKASKSTMKNIKRLKKGQ
jgi:hypothetical protein